MMQTILVTGGAGFIGSGLIRHLLAETACRVVTLDKLTYAGNLDSLGAGREHPRHHFVQGDVGDQPLVTRLLEDHQPDAVVHLAAESHVDRSIDSPEAFVQTNIVGTFRLLEAVLNWWQRLPPPRRDTFRLLHVSTDEVYGSAAADTAFTENSPYAPASPYAASKAAADHLVRAYHRTYGLPVLITNCSNNYGPYQFPEKLIPLMTLNALEGKPLPVYGDGRHQRDWLFVADHVQALHRVLQHGRPGETYNIGGGAVRSNLEIVTAICDLVDRLRPELPHRPCRNLIRFVPDRPGHDRRYALDCTKIAQQLGWRPSTSFEAGLEATVRWYLDNPGWVQRACAGRYALQRLGLARVGPGEAPSSLGPKEV